MRPEIEAFLRENGARYTTKALRAQLLRAGFDAPEIDAALEETEAARAPKLAETKALRSQFWGLAFVINLVVLVAVSAAVSNNSPYAGATFVVLGIAMLIGIGIAGSIGGALLPGRGLLLALAIPAAAALLLGGTCFAIMQPGSGSSVPPPTRYHGTMQLRLDEPLAFTGSGAATCETDPGLFSVNASDLGLLGNLPVTVFINATGSPVVQPSDGERKAYVQINISDPSTKVFYLFGVTSMEEGLPMQAADGASGMITFRQLQQQQTGASPLEGQDSISGTITWTCDLDNPNISSHLPGDSNGP